MNTKKKIAILGSGTGSNAARIITHFRNSVSIQVALVASNKKEAGILNVAREEKIPTLFIEKERFFYGDAYIPVLKEASVDCIILAGFLLKIPDQWISAFPNKIINIHPALLPKYGGKGMYGQFVHEAVLKNKEKETGITIHYVDEHYDNGDIIFQAACPVLESDTADSLARRVNALEHEHYPKIIEKLLNY